MPADTAKDGAVGGSPRIVKRGHAASAPPNLAEHDADRRAFDRTIARVLLDGLPRGGLNIAPEAVDLHAGGAEHEGLRCTGRRGDRQFFTWAALRVVANRVANALRGRKDGDPVFVLAGRTLQLHPTGSVR
jgi:acetyl-CoA synthetase